MSGRVRTAPVPSRDASRDASRRLIAELAFREGELARKRQRRVATLSAQERPEQPIQGAADVLARVNAVVHAREGAHHARAPTRP